MASRVIDKQARCFAGSKAMIWGAGEGLGSQPGTARASCRARFVVARGRDMVTHVLISLSLTSDKSVPGELQDGEINMSVRLRLRLGPCGGARTRVASGVFPDGLHLPPPRPQRRIVRSSRCGRELPRAWAAGCAFQEGGPDRLERTTCIG